MPCASTPPPSRGPYNSLEPFQPYFDGTPNTWAGRLDAVRGNEQNSAIRRIHLRKQRAGGGIDGGEGREAPREEVPGLHDDYMPPVVEELDLYEAGISSVIWAGGFRFDYGWIKPADLDEFGFPKASNGPANSPGLYFVGLPWLPRFSTALLSGVTEVSNAVAEDITARAERRI